MDTYKGLKLFTASKSVEEAKEAIAAEATGNQTGLYCRFERLNIAMMKYFRFGTFTLIAGRSGSGKSLFLNMLRNDFVNGLVKLGNTDTINPYLGEVMIPNDDGSFFYPESRITKLTNGDFIIKPLNDKCIHKVVLLHFGFEMSPVDENIRTAGTILGKSYSYLMSAEYNKTTHTYNRLTREEQDEITQILDSIGERKEYYAPISGNIEEMLATIDYVCDVNPNAKIVVTLDHALLTRRLDEAGTEQLVGSLGHFAITAVQKYDAMVLFLHQLNNEIEQADRIKNKQMHYPGKIDIHFGSQLWWAADVVMVLHVPKLLRIEKYGPEELDTNELAHLILIKSRFDKFGNIWLREQFSRGRLIESNISYFKKASNAVIGSRGSINLS
jgi:replicative DNA helicase